MIQINEIADAAIDKYEREYATKIVPSSARTARRIASLAARIAIDEVRATDQLAMYNRDRIKPETEYPIEGTQDGTQSSYGTVVKKGYEPLFGVLVEALNQAQSGKGAERHNLGGNIPFEDQRMQQISRLLNSPDGMAYQVCKKVTEGLDLPTLDRQVAELLGAIVYIAGIIVFLRDRA